MTSMLFLLLGCPSLFGLEELSSLPPEFPLALDGELGNITRPRDGAKIAVDVAFGSEDDARAAWSELQAQAARKGFASAGRTEQKNRETLRFSGPDGTVELGCCPQRADRRWLVFVAWTPDAGR